MSYMKIQKILYLYLFQLIFTKEIRCIVLISSAMYCISTQEYGGDVIMTTLEGEVEHQINYIMNHHISIHTKKKNERII